MELRNIVRGGNINFSSQTLPARSAEKKTANAARPSADRVELSRQWIQHMEEQRSRSETALLNAGKQKDKDSGGLLGYMETEEDKLDALSRQLDVQMKCMKIATNIMKGKKVPPEDEQYLMEHDPESYKLAVSMRGLVKEDDEECESVLKDEDKNGEETSETGESAPVESSGGGGETAPSGEGEAE